MGWADSGHRVVDRRTFLGVIAGGLLAAPPAGRAQRPDRRTLNSCILRDNGWPQARDACPVAVPGRTTCDTEDEAQS